jgi:hypothetical protein
MKTRTTPMLLALWMALAGLLVDRPAFAQLCGTPGVGDTHSDGQCPFGQL